MNDENVPYRSPVPIEVTSTANRFTKDEEEQSTLRQVQRTLRESLDRLDKWHAFDLTESELKLKQQIKAHAIAASILSPAVESVERALEKIDEAFKLRNQR
jgi:hypothetical protein